MSLITNWTKLAKLIKSVIIQNLIFNLDHLIHKEAVKIIAAHVMISANELLNLLNTVIHHCINNNLIITTKHEFLMILLIIKSTINIIAQIALEGAVILIMITNDVVISNATPIRRSATGLLLLLLMMMIRSPSEGEHTIRMMMRVIRLINNGAHKYSIIRVWRDEIRLMIIINPNWGGVGEIGIATLIIWWWYLGVERGIIRWK